MKVKKKENQIISQSETMDPSVERILNQDDDLDMDFENDSYDIPFESAMEP